ncbi:MAG: fumarate hydratase [Deltaproteobacteria bacterium]|nr:fumarate hydratase [Deltaproteobacteria bacterium]
MKNLQETFVELLRRAATDLPRDVEEALVRAQNDERRGTAAHSALGIILQNAVAAREASAPLCQDTGTHTWNVYLPDGAKTEPILKAIRGATVTATRKSYLRPNQMDSVSGKNSGDNIGAGHPGVHFVPWGKPGIHVDVLLKGGGCENCSTQYSLPEQRLGAGRDLAGVRATLLDAVHRSQGRGCAPGILGVAIGGDRTTGYATAKEQFFRPIQDVNPDPRLGALENDVLSCANRLGIGPMGFGGRTTLLAVKIAGLHRLPASYFVTVGYMCWACRRASVAIEGRNVRFSQSAVAGRSRRPAGQASGRREA